jgi:PHS family inorganic phosphate transporter-like MFS transporter
MGLGIGGDYPLSATITSEFSPTHVRGRLMTAVFACQGWGKLLASIVEIALTAGFKHRLVANDVSVCDYMWRLLVGLGCVPAAIALYFRLTIPETPRFTMDIDRNVQQATQDIETFLANGTYYADPDAAVMRVAAPTASRRDFVAYFRQWRNFKVLLGTAWSWFALDIAYYGLGINSDIFTSPFNGWARKLGVCHTGSDAHRNIYDSLCSRSVGNIIFALGGLIPGYWATFIFIDRWGRKPIQLMGFSVLTIIFVIMVCQFTLSICAHFRLLMVTPERHIR